MAGRSSRVASRCVQSIASALLQQLKLAASLDRFFVGRPRMDAIEECHKPGPGRIQSAAHRRGSQRKTHLDIGGSEFRTGKPGGLCKLRFQVIELPIDIRFYERCLDLARKGPCDRFGEEWHGCTFDAVEN